VNYNGLKCLVFLFCILPLHLDAALTTVRQTYVTADGKSANGTITIEVTRAFTAVDGKRVPVQRRIISFKGQLSVSLEPNSGSTPESFYQITTVVEGGGSENSIWLVPVSVTPVTVSSVVVSSVPSLSQMVLLTQLAQTGALSGQVVTWDGTQFVSRAIRYTASFSSQTTVTVTGATHGLGTADLAVTCYDTADPPHVVEGDGWTVNATTFDVVINFTNSQSGKCVLR
jgi:hypothetical protein